MSELEKYFEEESWNQFSSLFKNNNEAIVKMLAVNLDNNIILAIVIFGIFEKDSLKWITQKIPALNYLSPKECMAESKLKNRLKVCLMRMPQ